MELGRLVKGLMNGWIGGRWEDGWFDRGIDKYMDGEMGK